MTLTTGFLVPLGAGAANAAPEEPEPSTVFYLMTSGTPLVLPAALRAPKTSPQVVAPADAEWTVDAPQITVIVPEPEPEPVAPEPQPQATSRSSERVEPTPETPEPAPAPAVGAASGSVIDIAASLMGIPYLYGGTTTSGFDCSGYTQYVYAQVGVSLPRTSSAQASAGVAVSKSEGQPGDLVTMPGHVGIYAGNGMMYDAPRPGKTIQLRAIWTDNYQLRRVL